MSQATSGARMGGRRKFFILEAGPCLGLSAKVTGTTVFYSDLQQEFQLGYKAPQGGSQSQRPRCLTQSPGLNS